QTHRHLQNAFVLSEICCHFDGLLPFWCIYHKPVYLFSVLRIVKYIVLTLFSFLWLAGCSSGIARWMFEKNLIKDDYRYGDLYRMSNLSQFKELREECKMPEVRKVANTHLVLAGDSFTEEGRIESDYLSAAKFSRIRVDGATHVN